jgi:hypothetical protein
MDVLVNPSALMASSVLPLVWGYRAQASALAPEIFLLVKRTILLSLFIFRLNEHVYGEICWFLSFVYFLIGWHAGDVSLPPLRLGPML